MYLIDVAAGYPSFQAINLDFKVETPDSYLLYKFIRKDDGLI